MPSDDAKDVKFLDILQKNGRVTIKELSHKTGLTQSACTKRIQKMLADGKIRSFAPVMNHNHGSFGFNTLAFVLIKCRTSGRQAAEKVAEFLHKIDNVLEVHKVLGEHDFLIKVRTHSSDDLQVVLERIADSEYIADQKTILVSQTTLEEINVPATTLLAKNNVRPTVVRS